MMPSSRSRVIQDKDAKKVQSMITRFNKERLPNIVVTVDLLTTGIDIPEHLQSGVFAKSAQPYSL